MAARLVLHTGKGGAGASTAAAATAHALAARGRRTLLLAVGPAAEGLADVVGTELGAEPRPLGDAGPHAALAGAAGPLRAGAPTLAGWLDALLGAGRGAGAAGALDAPLPPGAGAVCGLLALGDAVADERWDVVVADAGPVAALRELLAAADVARWALERVLPRRPREGASRGIAAARALDLPLPGDRAAGDLSRLARRLLAAADVLTDPDRCSVRPVLAPGRAGLLAVERALKALALREVAADGVLAPPHADADAARAALAPLPVLAVAPATAPEELREAGAATWAGRDPALVLHPPDRADLVLDAADAELRLPLPFAAVEEVTVRKVGARLHVGVGDDARVIALPPAVAGWTATHAELSDGALRVGLEEAAGA